MIMTIEHTGSVTQASAQVKFIKLFVNNCKPSNLKEVIIRNQQQRAEALRILIDSIDSRRDFVSVKLWRQIFYIICSCVGVIVDICCVRNGWIVTFLTLISLPGKNSCNPSFSNSNTVIPY